MEANEPKTRIMDINLIREFIINKKRGSYYSFAKKKKGKKS